MKQLILSLIDKNSAIVEKADSGIVDTDTFGEYN
jgi:hypothetical protein